jgi:hypothetical protein
MRGYRFDLVLYMDSSAYVADVLQPLELLLHATQFLATGKAMLIANDHPRARWRALAGEGSSNAATGVFIMRRRWVGTLVILSLTHPHTQHWDRGM